MESHILTGHCTVIICHSLTCSLFSPFVLCVCFRFLQSPLPSILSDLSGLIKSSEDELATLQGQEKYLLKDLETTEKSIEEIVGKEQKAQ